MALIARELEDFHLWRRRWDWLSPVLVLLISVTSMNVPSSNQPFSTAFKPGSTCTSSLPRSSISRLASKLGSTISFLHPGPSLFLHKLYVAASARYAFTDNTFANNETLVFTSCSKLCHCRAKLSTVDISMSLVHLKHDPVGNVGKDTIKGWGKECRLDLWASLIASIYEYSTEIVARIYAAKAGPQ